jgi:hypothetical protein
MELVPRELSSQEIDDLVSFLEALTDLPTVEVPDQLPSGLDPPR